MPHRVELLKKERLALTECLILAHPSQLDTLATKEAE
jgi:hypothetical protein